MESFATFGLEILVASFRGLDPFNGVAARTLMTLSAAAILTLARISFLGLGLFSRLEPRTLNDQATRARLRSLIHDQPGVSLTELAHQVGLGWGTVVYHLNRLEAAQLVRSESAGRRRAFYLPGQESVPQPADSGAGPVKRALLERLRQQPGLAQSQLARHASISLPLAHRYLWQLEGEGLVTSVRRGKQRVYAPTAALEQYVAHARPTGPVIHATAMVVPLARQTEPIEANS